MMIEYGFDRRGTPPNIWLRFPYSQAAVEKVKLIPGRRWDPARKLWWWHLDEGEQAVVAAIVEQFPEAVFNSKCELSASGLPDVDGVPLADLAEPAVFDSPGYEPYGASLVREKFLLLDQMGVGKTGTAIWSACLALDAGDVERVVVLVPLSVRANWLREIRECAWVAPDRTVVVRRNPPKASGQRLSGLSDREYRERMLARAARPERCTWLVCHYDVVRRHIEELRHLVAGQFLIADECQKIKGPGSAVSRAVRSFDPSRFIGLTGTIVANTPPDVWSAGHMTAPELFGSWDAFCHNYVTSVTIKPKPTCVKCGYRGRETICPRCGGRMKGKRGFRKVTGYRNLHDLHQRLALVSLRRTKEECLDLPPKIRQSRDCPMSPAQEQMYRAVQEEGLLMLMGKDGEWARTHQVRVRAELVRLCQICDGYGSPQAGIDAWLPEHGKAAVLDDLLEELTGEGRKVVVWSRFRPPIEWLTERYKKQYGAVCIHGDVPPDEREALMARFNADEGCRLFVGQVQAAGLGVNLQAASAVVFYDLPWTPSIMLQAEDRSHRIGTERAVDVIDLRAVWGDGETTVDHAVAGKLLRKQGWADQVTGDEARAAGGAEAQFSLEEALRLFGKGRRADNAEYEGRIAHEVHSQSESATKTA